METTVSNPLIWADIPDVDVIRVGSIFYMVSTSMHSMPGCPIMKSTDLAHWEFVSYVFNTFENNDAHNLLNGKNIYGNGSWAASLRFHNGRYYVLFNCNDKGHAYIYSTDDIENGKWTGWSLPGMYHDPALIFDGDTPYIIYGCGDIRILELKKDLSGLCKGGTDRLLFSTPKEGIGLRCEGGHAYYINGKYYLIYIEWPREGKGRRREICYRSDLLLGEYERKIIFDDDMGYHNSGIAQGAIFEGTEGEWYAMLFQDHGAVGRIPYLLPLCWENGWPVLGTDGRASESFVVPYASQKESPVTVSDDFCHEGNCLAINWQWNHNPDNSLWSFTEHKGYLRLTNGPVNLSGILQARNTLTQRTEGPACSCEVRLETAGMKPGDCAGLAAFEGKFGIIGIRVDENGEKYTVMCINNGNGGELVTEKLPYGAEAIYLRINFDFDDNHDLAEFLFSEDGVHFRRSGQLLHMEYRLDHFMGCRIGLYSYATIEEGGYADFTGFRYCKGKEVLGTKPFPLV